MLLLNNDIFALAEAAMTEALMKPRYKTSGLKLFNRPHDLSTVVNKENGEVQSYVISTVYTPFAKGDIKVRTKNDRNGPRLIITMEKSDENEYTTDKVDTDKEKNSVICEYCGISKKSISYELPLSDRIVLKDISVKAEDGILTITLPVDNSKESDTLIPIK